MARQQSVRARVAAERAEKALEMHLAGVGYAGIARALDYSGPGSAWKAVRRALEVRGVTRDRREAARSTLARLDAMLTGLWPKAKRGDVGAVDRVLQIGQRRAELLRLLAEEEPPEPSPTGLSRFEERLLERQQSWMRPPKHE